MSVWPPQWARSAGLAAKMSARPTRWARSAGLAAELSTSPHASTLMRRARTHRRSCDEPARIDAHATSPHASTLVRRARTHRRSCGEPARIDAHAASPHASTLVRRARTHRRSCDEPASYEPWWRARGTHRSRASFRHSAPTRTSSGSGRRANRRTESGVMPATRAINAASFQPWCRASATSARRSMMRQPCAAECAANAICSSGTAGTIRAGAGCGKGVPPVLTDESSVTMRWNHASKCSRRRPSTSANRSAVTHGFELRADHASMGRQQPLQRVAYQPPAGRIEMHVADDGDESIGTHDFRGWHALPGAPHVVRPRERSQPLGELRVQLVRRVRWHDQMRVVGHQARRDGVRREPLQAPPETQRHIRVDERLLAGQRVRSQVHERHHSLSARRTLDCQESPRTRSRRTPPNCRRGSAQQLPPPGPCSPPAAAARGRPLQIAGSAASGGGPRRATARKPSSVRFPAEMSVWPTQWARSAGLTAEMSVRPTQ